MMTGTCRPRNQNHPQKQSNGEYMNVYQQLDGQIFLVFKFNWQKQTRTIVGWPKIDFSQKKQCVELYALVFEIDVVHDLSCIYPVLQASSSYIYKVNQPQGCEVFSYLSTYMHFRKMHETMKNIFIVLISYYPLTKLLGSTEKGRQELFYYTFV